MSNQVKERNEIEEQYRWDLSTLYASDEAFEEDFAKLDACIAKVAAFQGKLTDALLICRLLRHTDYQHLIFAFRVVHHLCGVTFPGIQSTQITRIICLYLLVVVIP